MIRPILVLAFLLSVVCAFTQAAYRPRPGESVLKVDVEGRGTYYILLFAKEAPKTTAHIAKLVGAKFYDGQRFHRVERSPKPFLVQIGDPQTKNVPIDNATIGQGGSGAKIAYEDSGYSNNQAGMVGLAASPTDRNSGDSQFYVLLDSASFLDGNYTVFGKVVFGLDVVKRIERGDRVTSISLISG